MQPGWSGWRPPGWIMCSCRSRTPTPDRPTASQATGARMPASWRSPVAVVGLRDGADRQCRDPSRQYRPGDCHGGTGRFTRGRPGRGRARAVLRLGAAQPGCADADARAGGARDGRVERIRPATRAGWRSISWFRTIMPERPKPCMGGWGRRSLNVTPSGLVLPCHAAETIPRAGILVGARSFAGGNLGAFAGVPGVSRHRLDAGAMPVLRFREIDFGGCRCQALAIAGDAAATDPACELSPHHCADAGTGGRAPSSRPLHYAYRGRRGASDAIPTPVR